MKKIIIAVLAVALCISAVCGANWLFGNPGGVEIDYNDCTVYSKEDVDSAAQVVIEKMDSMKGCVLYSLKYRNADKREYCRSINQEADCIVFDSVFRSPLISYGAWIGNSIYTWHWYLERAEGGNWELLGWGYA